MANTNPTIWCSSYRGQKIDGVQTSTLPLTNSSNNTPSSSCVTKTLIQSNCIGYRNKSTANSQNINFPQIHSNDIIRASNVNQLRTIIANEIKARRANKMYQNVSNQISSNTVLSNQVNVGDSIYAKYINSLDSIILQYQRDTYNQTAGEYATRQIGNIVSANNDIVSVVKNTIDDCICYSDCNGYYYKAYVDPGPGCACYGYCNFY